MLLHIHDIVTRLRTPCGVCGVHHMPRVEHRTDQRRTLRSVHNFFKNFQTETPLLSCTIFSCKNRVRAREDVNAYSTGCLFTIAQSPQTAQTETLLPL